MFRNKNRPSFVENEEKTDLDSIMRPIQIELPKFPPVTFTAKNE